MAEDLEARFKKAVWLVRNGPKLDSSNEQKLAFYKFYKQVGPCGTNVVEHQGVLDTLDN
jgi:hypothetical protein